MMMVFLELISFLIKLLLTSVSIVLPDFEIIIKRLRCNFIFFLSVLFFADLNYQEI